MKYLSSAPMHFAGAGDKSPMKPVGCEFCDRGVKKRFVGGKWKHWGNGGFIACPREA